MSIVSENTMPVIPGMKFDIPGFCQDQPKTIINWVQNITEYAIMASPEGFEAVDLTKLSSACSLSSNAFGFVSLPENLYSFGKDLGSCEIRNVTVDTAKIGGNVCDIAKVFSKSGAIEMIDATAVGYCKNGLMMYSNGNKIYDNVVKLYQVSQRDDEERTELERAKSWYEDRAIVSDLVKSSLLVLTHAMSLAPLLLGIAISSTLLTILGTMTLVALTVKFFFDENAKDPQVNLSIA